MNHCHFNIYKLKFTTPLHLSRGKLSSYESSDTTLHSDTIKSALFVSMLHLYGEDEALIFMENVHVSSGFPFDQDGCWLPKPLSFKFGIGVESPTNRKSLKKIQFFTTKQYEQILKNESPTLYSDGLGGYRQPKVWTREVTQRVNVKIDDDSEPFYIEKLYPQNESAGLYVIVLGDYDKEKLDAAFKLLGDNGIGLQRNLGNGQFSISKDVLTIDVPTHSSAWIALSLYRPSDKEEIESVLQESSYQFIKRGGWISSPEHEEHIGLRKQAVMMFTEGSVFAFPDSCSTALIKGKKENVRPDWDDDRLHPIFRDGRAIFLPIAFPV